MDKVVLKASRRDVTGKGVKTLRRQGLLPAVMYGHNFEPVAISLDAHSTALTLSKVSSSAIITIDVDGDQQTVLVREKQRDYLKNQLLHVDFQVVSQYETIRAAVTIELTGTSPAVRDLNGVLVTNLTQIQVEALPRNLPERFSLDISSLDTIGSAIYVRDIVVPSGVTILTDPEESVAVVTGAAVEVEEPVEVEEGEEPEVIERGKKEEEEE